jgi:hypothetical protein
MRYLDALGEPPILPVVGGVPSGFASPEAALLREEEGNQAVDVFFA